MNTEEKDHVLASKSAIRRSRRTPVATASGHNMFRTSTEATPTRRKRIRITPMDPLLNELQDMATKRFAQHIGVVEPNQGHRREGQFRAGVHQRTQRDMVSEDISRRMEYERRYQAKRAEGDYSFNYNRGERPQRRGKAFVSQAGQAVDAKKPKKKKYKPITPVKYKVEEDPTKEIRLNKYLANAGHCSRREADQRIAEGRVTVNGVVVTELGTRVTCNDVVVCDGARQEAESKVYVLLNKPKNCVTTSDDPKGRLTVMDIVSRACPERIYPVGRLDRQTTGVLLITNDGELSSKLTHPSFMKKKIYHVWLNKPVAMEDMQRIAEGIELEDGEIHADAISYVKEDDLREVGIEIHSGRNRIVRRIFEHLGYRVVKLDRVYFAGLTKKNLPRGRWRYLNAEEVEALKMGAFE